MVVKNNLNRVSLSHVILTTLLTIFMTGCSGAGRTVSLEEFKRSTGVSPNVKLNDRLKSGAVLDKAELNEHIYLLGEGDLIEVSVFRVDELTRTVRINGRGDIVLPLLGAISVAGKSVGDVEINIAERLKTDYLQDPQVSLFVKEYRSQQITVMGAVNNPDIYSITRTRGVVEMLSLAGGVSDSAADTIRINTTQIDPESNQPVKQNIILSINGLLSDREAMSGVRLAGGDVIFVPEAGVVYVEGAVVKPGAYKMTGDVKVLQAISMAGGIPWAANQSKIRVVRDIAGNSTAVEINLNRIRAQKDEDVLLQDGDIVIVNYQGGKRFLSSLYKGVTSVVGFGYQL